MNLIKRKEHLQVGFVVLLLIICFLLIKSATIGINNIKATCKPLSEAGQNSPKVSDLEVLGELQQQIMEDSASVAVEEAPPEPELAEDTSLVSVESYEPVLVAADEPEAIEEAESEESLDESEPWIAEDTPYEAAAESALVVVAEPEPEPEMVEEPDLEVIEETEVGATEETDAELFAQVEAAKTPEAFEWEAFEKSQQQITEESTSVAVEEAPPEPALAEEPSLETVESYDPVLDAADEPEEIEEAESEERLDESEPWIAEDIPFEAAVESTFMAVTEPEPEPEMAEEPDLEVIAQAESEESPDASEPWIAEDISVEAAVESTFMVEAEPEPEPEMVEEPDLEVIAQAEPEESPDASEPWIAEDVSYEATAESTFMVVEEVGAEETLVAYELEVVEEPHQEIVKEPESLASCLQGVLGELKTIDVEEPMIESIEASEPEVVEESQLEVSMIEEETERVSLYLANIFGKAVPTVTKEPQAATAKEVEPNETPEASEPEVVEKPRQQSVEKQKSVFSYLQEVLKKLKQ